MAPEAQDPRVLEGWPIFLLAPRRQVHLIPSPRSLRKPVLKQEKSALPSTHYRQAARLLCSPEPWLLLHGSSAPLPTSSQQFLVPSPRWPQVFSTPGFHMHLSLTCARTFYLASPLPLLSTSSLADISSHHTTSHHNPPPHLCRGPSHAHTSMELSLPPV